MRLPTSRPNTAECQRPSAGSIKGVTLQYPGVPDPALVFTLRWLRGNVPDVDGPVVLVQGDTGPGNFMFADGRVVAVVDWELAHLGDPMDDIAWLSLRSGGRLHGSFLALFSRGSLWQRRGRWRRNW